MTRLKDGHRILCGHRAVAPYRIHVVWAYQKATIAHIEVGGRY